MRHRNSGRALSRTSSHRKAMFSNMCCSLIEHELIKTTVAKAKELRSYIEPMITVSKEDSVAARRRMFAKLRSKSAVGKLFTTLGPRYVERPGGYLRILKCGFRDGDNAPMAIVELVDRNLQVATKEEPKEIKAKEVKGKPAKEAKPAKAKKVKIEDLESKELESKAAEKEDKTE